MVNRINGEASASPCTRQCGLEANVICRGCFRTIKEIKEWRGYTVSQCMKVMEEINGARGTHTCPSCEGPAYCAMEAGKSANTCWCMELPMEAKPNVQIAEECLCRQCLTKELKKVTGIKDVSRH